MSGQAGYEYERAAAAIKSMITAGKINVGDGIKVPEIQKLTGTTNATARRTAAELTAEGILQSHHGKSFAVVAMPEEAAAKRADARELAQQVGQLRDQVRELSAQMDPSGEFGERLERVESNVEDLYDKLGFEYERGEETPTAARREPAR